MFARAEPMDGPFAGSWVDAFRSWRSDNDEDECTDCRSDTADGFRKRM
jgi:hypothetical protein